MKSLRNAILGLLGAVGLALWPLGPASANSSSSAAQDGSALSLAICPIVYPLDQFPSDRGFHYTFYGNGFFINEEGYLLTAAHVLSQLSDSSPFIVLRLPMAPPRFVKTEVVAIDREHDVALLRATPNPFQGRYQVQYLPLAVARPGRAQSVLAAALRPSRLRDPHTFDAFGEDRPAGEVLRYEFSQLDRGGAETELLLFRHEVLLGDSGAPVVSAQSQTVVGLIEGRWLRENATLLTAAAKQPESGIGAAIPIHYAIAMLQRQGVAWHEAQPEGGKAGAAVAPTPLSLISAAAPAQALEGGEVVLDARLGRNGEVEDVRVARGAPLFAEKALSAVRTWSFQPASVVASGASRMGIVFQFVPPGAMPDKQKERRYDPPDGELRERGPFPIVTKALEISADSPAEGSVIVTAQINSDGEAAEWQVVNDANGLAPTVLPAVKEWQFAPGKCAGADCASTMILVFVPRQGMAPTQAHTNRQARPLSK